MIILFKKRSIEFRIESFIVFEFLKLLQKYTILKRYLKWDGQLQRLNINSGHATLKSNRRHFVRREYKVDDVALLTIRISNFI